MATLAIIGSRSFTNQARAEEAFVRYCCERTPTTLLSRFDTIVSGGARGSDQIGAAIARKYSLKLVEHIPDWDRLGKKAGFVRNEAIIRAADVVLAFWGVDPKTGELSRGTQHSIGLAKKARKTTIIVYV